MGGIVTNASFMPVITSVSELKQHRITGFGFENGRCFSWTLFLLSSSGPAEI